MPVVVRTRPKSSGPMHVPGGQIGPRPAALVLVLDPRGSAGAAGSGGWLRCRA